MDNEILELYEQVKDKLTIEEFQAKINDISKENEELSWVDDYYAAQQVVNNIIGASEDDQKSNGEIFFRNIIYSCFKFFYSQFIFDLFI